MVGVGFGDKDASRAGWSAKSTHLLAHQQLAACGRELIRKSLTVDALQLRDAGKGVILISADLNEIMELSDSILVMCGGQAAAYFEDAKKVDEFELGNYMLGLKRQEEMNA